MTFGERVERLPRSPLLGGGAVRTAFPARVLGPAALAGLLVAGFTLAAGAAGDRLYHFVPAGRGGFPGWLLGPLSHLGITLTPSGGAVALVVMSACYLIALACAGALSLRVALGAVVAFHVVFLLAPPLFSADVFGYIDYSRLGALHHLNPYVQPPSAAPHDAVYPWVGWKDIKSAYGPLFTLFGYALTPLGVATALWAYKAIAALAGIGCVLLVRHLAERRGQDPVAAVLFVGANPIVLAYGVGGAHNDLLLMLLVLVGIWLALDGRAAGAGASLAAAAAIKASAAIVAPFALVAARERRRMLLAMVAVAVVLAGAALAVLGAHGLDFVDQIRQQQRDLVARYSVPAWLGRQLGYSQPTAGIKLAAAIVAIAGSAWALWRTWRGADWIVGAGWATLAVLVSSVWLLVWYVAWLLPLAAIGSSRRLRLAGLLFFGYLVATRVAPYL